MPDYSIQLSAKPSDDGFDILAINAGDAKGHGISFSREVLMQSVSMIDRLPVFIDHAGLGNAPSVRNLAGTLQTPSWNEAEQGIQAKLRASGPAADVLLALREAARGDMAIMQAVGFSMVVNVQLNKQGQVTKIVRVKSVDVVIDPARGGRFLSALSGSALSVAKGQKENIMTNQIDNEQVALTETQSTALELQGANEAIAELQSKQKQANDMLLAQCESLLESSLSASKLPAASQKAIRKPFHAMIDAGKPFTAEQLQTAITEKREELSEISAGNNVQGPGRVSIGSMYNSADQFKLALEDLMGADRDEKDKNIKVHTLRGIQEAYLMATGDREFTGGYFPEFALVTANFPFVVANVMNKILIKHWTKLGSAGYEWWKEIATVEHFSNLNEITWLKTGTIASLPVVAERGTYTELPVGDQGETADWTKYGGYIPITLEAMLRDDLRALKAMPREAALGGIRNVSEQVAAIFTAAAGLGPTLDDGGTLFNATAVTTAGGHKNLLTTALGSDYTAWEAVASAVYAQPMPTTAATIGTGKKQAIEPDILLIPRAMKAAAEALFMPRWASNVTAIATLGGPTYGGMVKPVVVPEWTDTNNWATVVNKDITPSVMIGEIFGVMPQIFVAGNELDPAMFTNDESRIKVRQFLAIGVSDYRGLHKSNVA